MWLLLDNFEWEYGYFIRFGFYYIDCENDFKWYFKDFVYWFKQFFNILVLKGE